MFPLFSLLRNYSSILPDQYDVALHQEMAHVISEITVD